MVLMKTETGSLICAQNAFQFLSLDKQEERMPGTLLTPWRSCHQGQRSDFPVSLEEASVCFSGDVDSTTSSEKTRKRDWNLLRGARAKRMDANSSRTGKSENDERKIAPEPCSGPNTWENIGSFAPGDSFAHFRPYRRNGRSARLAGCRSIS